MKILVTGGSGFIGSNFIRRALASSPHEIVNLDLLTYAGNPANLREIENDPRYRFVQGDIGDAQLVARLFDEHGIEAVANFAAESHVDRSIDTPEPFFQTNVIGTLRLLDTTRRAWAAMEPVRRDAFRFLHVSTDEVFGSLGPDDPRFSETSNFEPNSPYSASKASSDHIVRACHHTFGLPVVTTNCSNNYGPFQFPEKLIPLMILSALGGKPLPIYGDGQNIRDWLYVDDHCTAILAVLERGRVGETYNVGGDCERTNLHVVDAICSTLDELRPRADGQPYSTQKTFVKDRPGHDRRYAINCEKLKAELGWTQQETFESGLRRTIEWYLAHADWVDEVVGNRYQLQRLGL
jgi:dTDP-glucose 4,6-dehydratase